MRQRSEQKTLHDGDRLAGDQGPQLAWILNLDQEIEPIGRIFGSDARKGGVA